jgi:DNA-binding response OmpR family regulator
MLVVLAKREAGVQSTVQFLERRGFAAKYVSSLNEAVELFSKKEANMLLLSVNFPHPKVEMISILMQQSFQVETILFAEENDRKTSNKLNNAKTKHVLFGPVSGPVVMMKIRQIDREMSGETEEKSANSSHALSSKDDGGDIKIGGRKSSEDDTVVLNGKTESDRKASFDTLMRSLSGENESEANPGDQLERSGDTYVQKGERSKMKSAGDDTENDENGSLSERAQDLRAALDRGLTETPPSEGKRGRLIEPNSFRRPMSTRPTEMSAETNEDPAPSYDEAAPSYEEAVEALRKAEHAKALEAARQREEREAAEAAKKAAREAEIAKQKSENEAMAAKQRAEREEMAAKMKAEREALAAKTKAENEAAAAATAAARKAERDAAACARRIVDEAISATEEMIHRCLYEALAVVAGSPTEEEHQLTAHVQAALISLRTSKLNCAFVVSLNYAKQTATELFQRMEVAFFSLLRDNGVEFENDQTYSIFLDNMKVVREAFANSEYSVIARTTEIEMGAARVDAANPVAKTQPYEENMHSISIQDLPVDEPVTFSLFLHLKQNGKFLRYLKKGSSISDRQVERLAKHHALGLVEQDEIEAYRRLYAAHAIHAVKKTAA